MKVLIEVECVGDGDWYAELAKILNTVPIKVCDQLDPDQGAAWRADRKPNPDIKRLIDSKGKQVGTVTVVLRP